MITYPVSPTARFSVLQISTGQIIARNNPWPVADGTAIPGLDPDYVYLEQVSDTAPDYDSRLFSLQSAEVVDADEQEIRTVWTMVDLDINDVQVNLANVEIAKLEDQVPDREFKKMVILALATLFRQVANQALTNRELRVKERVLARGRAVWDNDQRHANLKTAVLAGQKPDLDTGWAEVPSDPA